MDSEPKISRRDFLKLAGATAGAGAMAYLGFDKALSTTEKPTPTEEYLRPELVHGVEVYGLNEKITAKRQIEGLYRYLDQQFASVHDLKGWEVLFRSSRELRKELLDPNQRNLEVVIRQSAYDSFLRRKDETQVDFVEWIKMHVEAMNLCFENGKPSANIQTVLKRIVVIDDKLPKGFWDESKFRDDNGPNLDWKWKWEFDSPIDIDCSWAVADDYRPEDLTDEMVHGYFWRCSSKDGQVKFERSDREESYSFPIEDQTSFSGKSKIWMDFGLTHEWLHYLHNLPDEYAFDIHDPSQRFQHFLFATGSFTEPSISPFLSSVANHHVSKKLRDHTAEGYGKGYSFKEIPQNISLTVTDGSEQNIQLQLHTAYTHQGGQRNITPTPTIESSNGTLRLDDSIAKSDPHTMLLKTNTDKELFIPYAVFMMSKIAGVERSNYEIEFTGYDDPNKKTQIMKLVDDSDVEKFLQDKKARGDKPYAKTKGDGTDTWFVWFLRD